MYFVDDRRKQKRKISLIQSTRTSEYSCLKNKLFNLILCLQSGNRVMMVQQNNPALLKPAHVIVETELAIAAERFLGTEFSSVTVFFFFFI